MPIRDDELMGLSPEERRKRLQSLRMPEASGPQAPVAPEGFSFPENPEQGLEDEGFVDVIKPYKQYAAKELREADHPILADATELLVPDSPMDLLPSGQSGPAVLSAHIPFKKGAKAADLADTSASMKKVKDMVKAATPTGQVGPIAEAAIPSRRPHLERMREQREILHTANPATMENALLKSGYPLQEITKQTAGGNFDKAIQLHHEAVKKMDTRDPLQMAAVEKQMQEIQKAYGDSVEFSDWLKGPGGILDAE